ncbi:MAG: PilZ domain-containing protein [Myxococcota bacterium]
MHHVAPTETLPDRSSRAPFKYPVRVTIAGERVVRVLSGDLSTTGMFLVMAEPPEPGTVVQLAFEAGGRVLPFAEGEVAWRRTSDTRGGFGVRFTRFLHPRAKALIDYLCENITAGTPIKPPRPSPLLRRRWQGLAALAAAAVLLIASRIGVPTAPVTAVTIDPSLVCRMEPGMTACPQLAAAPAAKAPTPAPAPAKKAAPLARLQEAPRPAPTVTRTLFSAAKPATLTSTPIPSGAARLVTISRVSGAVRVAVDPVAGGLVKSVRALSGPPRLVIDVTGIAPISEHVLPVKDPEVLRVKATALGKKTTRLVVELARTPSRVVQQGDSALVSY